LSNKIVQQLTALGPPDSRAVTTPVTRALGREPEAELARTPDDDSIASEAPAGRSQLDMGLAEAWAEGNPWLAKLSPAKRNEVFKYAVQHIANNSSLFERTEDGGGDQSVYERLAIAIARSGVEEAENIFVEAASSAQDAVPEEDLRLFYQSCTAGRADQDGITGGTVINKARELGADFGPWEHVAATSTLTALYAPGKEQKCRELLDHVVAADGCTFTLGDRSGPLVILRKPKDDTLPSGTKWQGDLPAATLAKPADIMMRAERLTWMQRAGGKSDDRFIRTAPPRAFVNDYLDQMRGQYAAAPLLGIVRIPRIDDLGVIHFTPGYDGQTGLFHDRVPGFYVPLTPTLDSAREAAEALLLPFSKYKFENSQVGNALLLAAIFTALERPFIPVAPMFVIRSSMPGTGKGLIVNSLARLAYDTKPVVVTWGGNNEEFEKRLAALLLQAPAALSVDNANGMQITGDLLESIITEGCADIRPLGRSETVRVRNRSVLMLTGNNPIITGDMARRALPVSILPQSSDPERDRYGFDPVTVVSQRRSELLQAAFTAMRAFRLAGMPEHGLAAAGSFDQWSRKVRDLVYWITDYDVTEGFRQNKAEDPRLQGDAALLAALHGHFGSKPFRAAEVIATHGRVVSMRHGNGSCTGAEQAVHEALENVLGRSALTAKVVGYWARRVNGARIDGYLLETHQNSKTHTNEITIKQV
jgi:putative DNA primase/helicase